MSKQIKSKIPLNCIIIGASSGIGRALAQVLANNGYILGLTSRREHLLIDLQNQLPTKSFIKTMDVIKTEEATKSLFELIDEMGGVDLIILNAGVGFSSSHMDWGKDALNWDKERLTIETNVFGFTALAMAAYHYFLKKGSGHIVGISSVAGLIPNSQTPSYSASKCFISNFLSGLRINAHRKKTSITITEIRPGWVDTPLLVRREKVFWIASPEKVANQIFEAIKRKKELAYVTKRWAITPWVLKIIPKALKNRFF